MDAISHESEADDCAKKQTLANNHSRRQLEASQAPTSPTATSRSERDMPHARNTMLLEADNHLSFPVVPMCALLPRSRVLVVLAR